MAGRSWNTKLSLLLITAVMLSLIIQVSIQHVSTQADSPEITDINLPPVVSAKHSNPKMDSALSQLVEAADQGKAAHFAQQHGIAFEANKSRIVIEVQPGKLQSVIETVETLGGIIESSYGNLIQANLDVSLLENLSANTNVYFIRPPREPFAEITIESMGLINATAWNSAGYNGSGVNIGVLDLGFANYSTMLGTELPSSVTVNWSYSAEGQGSDVHGTACAEIIHDIAPAASLFFATCDTEVNASLAVDWLIEQEVDIISCSITFLNDGPGDGTGPICDAVDKAATAGILWINAAGDHAEGHWMGDWSDTNGNDYHNFYSNDDTNTISVPSGKQIWIGLRWDDPWGASYNDYDLRLFNSSDLVNPVAMSENAQNGLPGQEPTEEIKYTTTYPDTYHIAIYNYSADGTSELHLFYMSTLYDLQYKNPEYSILQPADSPNAMAVGAVKWSVPNVNESFSSQGPTTDNRTKPDIVGPDYVSTATYGTQYFGGTSAAAPHVAGAAALVKQMYPLYTYTDLQSHLEFSAIELGDAGKDNVYGSGRLYLDPTPPYPETTIDDIPDYVEDLSAINGSASCAYASISNVEIRINRGSDNYFWNGAVWQSGDIWIDTEAIDGAFGSATESWTINGTTSPALPAAWTKGCAYNIAARAVDNESTADQTPATESFYVGKFGWDTMEIDNGDDLFGIWGNNTSDIFVVGGDPSPEYESYIITHYDGEFWNISESGSGYVLRDIWGFSDSDIFSVGSSGTILHYDGGAWNIMDSDSTDYLYGIWGTNNSDIFTVGSSGTILYYNGSSWNEMSSGCTDTLTGIWGNAFNDVYAVGFNESTADGIILHFDGSDWETISGDWLALLDIWGSSSSDIFVTGASGTILHYNGSSWSSMISSTGNDLETVWGTSSSNVVAAGHAGTTLHYEGTYWIPYYSGTANIINSLWGTASDVYAVGNKGTILHYKAYPDNSIYMTAPEYVEEGDDFIITVSISKTSDLFGGQFYIQYDPNIITISNVQDGLLYDTTPYPLTIEGGWSLNGSGEEGQGLLRTYFNLWNYGEPTGAREAIADIECHAVANGSTGLTFTPNSYLIDYYSSNISMNWYNNSITVYEHHPLEITDLSCSSINQSAIHLEWTATGSGGGEYDIRWRPGDAISEDNWSYSTTQKYTGEPIVPQAANASESLDITGLENNTFYYFAVKVSNPGSSFSDLSNICGNTTQGYVLALTSSPPEGGNTSGSGTYSLNAIVNIDAAPNACYQFSEWTGNISALTGAATNASNSVIMSDHVSLTANFDMITYDLTTASTAGGSVTAPGEAGPYTYNCSEVVNIVATPDSCYHFVNWTGDTAGIGDVNDPTTTVTMLGNYSIMANFEITTYNLATAITGTGSTSGDGTYNCGAYADITATETDSCWVFDHWSGSGITDVNDPTTTVLIDGDKTVTAVFTQLTYDLTTAHTGTGSTSGDGTYNCGAYADITATETDSCWVFDHWSGSGITDVNDPTTTVLIDGDKTVTAVFTQLTYDLTTAHTGTGTTSGDGNFNCGVYADITATETDSCWVFDHWSGSGITDVNDPTTTVLIDGDKTVTAVFVQVTYDLTTAVTGTGSASGDGTYGCGAYADITATQTDPCWIFDHWSGSGITDVNDPTTTVLIDGDKTVTAVFVLSGPFNLDISTSENGSVTTPGEGSFGPYNCSTVINLTAEPELGYEFVSWSGDISDIADPYSASTTITMYDDYSITANFGLPPTGFHGDADRDGELSIGDYSFLRLMLFNKQPFNPGGDADQDGLLSIGDYSFLRLMLFGKQPIVDKYEVTYDFVSGADSNKWARSKTVSSVPPADNYDNESGWIDAVIPDDYDDIALTDDIVWTITGTPGNYSALQCKFTVVNNPADITSIGVTLNGSSGIDAGTLRFYAWNFDTASWTQIGTDFSMTTSIASYSSWTAWGKVYADYIDGSQHMYIIAVLNTANSNLNIDYIKLTVAHP